MPSSIKTHAEFRARLLDAIRDTGDLATRDPDAMIASIARQLAFVEQWTREGRRPAQEDLDRLTFGLMASRSVSETDSRLANELYELASHLQYWPNGPRDPDS